MIERNALFPVWLWVCLSLWPIGAAARPPIVLVHDIGLSPEIWRVGGLESTLAEAGYEVHRVDWRPLGDAGLADVARMVGNTVRDAPRPPVVIGHGLGGTAAAISVADGAEVAGLALIGAPLGFGGSSRALREVFEASARASPRPLDWARLGSRVGGGNRTPLARRLLTTGMPPTRRRELWLHGLAWLPPRLVAEWRKYDGGRPVPSALPAAAALAELDALPWLVIVGVADGLAPPWQCDPTAFDLDPPALRRVYVTRANGAPIEYNHLDLVAHPDARDDVFSPLVEWLAIL